MAPGVFSIPHVPDNSDGWGPTTVPADLQGVPFAPFNKGDRVGKVADWTQSGYKNYGQGRQGQGVAVFNFTMEEESDYTLVDNRPVQKKGYMRRPQQRFQQRRDQYGRNEQDRQQKGKQQNKRVQQQRDMQRVQYSSSVDIRPEWSVLEQIPFPALSKLSMQVGEPEDVLCCGQVEYYDKAFDRVQPKTSVKLEKTNRAFRSVTTSDDPKLKQFAEEGKARVFCTDLLLATLMCTTRSVYSWDIVVTRSGDKLFFDKRDNSTLDLLTVNETAPDPIPEERDNINGVHQLQLEATAINQNFSQQVLERGGEKCTYDAPNPFKSEGDSEELASVAYKYRKWSIGDDIDIIVRCELDGAMKWKGDNQMINVKALNAIQQTALDWRQKLESQRGAVLAMELKNNANKIAKWTAQALLAGADMIKLGFVSRVVPHDNVNHVILGTQMQKPRDFAMQMNLNMDNCWGVVRAIVDLCLKLDDGKYLVVKDPNKPLLRLYGIPEDAFETTYTEDPMEDADDEAGPERA